MVMPLEGVCGQCGHFSTRGRQVAQTKPAVEGPATSGKPEVLLCSCLTDQYSQEGDNAHGQ